MDLTFIPDVPLWITAIVVVIAALYLYLTWNFGFLEKQGVKTRKPWPLVGSLRIAPLEPAVKFQKELYQEFGRISGYYEGRHPVLHIGEPELIKQITVKDFWAFPFSRDLKLSEKDVIAKKFLTNLHGEEWKRMRSLMTPAFTTGKLKQMSHLIEDCCKTLVQNMNDYAETGEPLETKKFMSAYMLDVIALCAFGTKIDCLANPDNAFVRYAFKIFNQKIPTSAMLIFLFPFLGKILPSFSFFPLDSMNFFKSAIEQVIAMRQNNMYPRDFLALLLEANIGENEHHDEKAQPPKLQDAKKGLGLDSLIAQAVLFLAAGYESTSILLCFAVYQLAVDPEIQEKLAAEVEEVTSKHDGKITYEAVAEMTYLDMVVSETLRMYPPAIRPERTCVVDDYEIAGIKLQKGMVVGFPVYCIHHDPEFYPDPEKFIPERFTAENKAKRSPFVYLPFGAGPRNCIAMRFVLMEAKITLATIISEFVIKKCPQTELELEFSATIPLLQPKSLTVAIEKRRRN